MIGADLIRFGAQGALALLLITHHAQLWHIVALHAIGGGASAFFGPATSGLIRDIVPSTALQRANGMLNLVRSMSSMLALGVSATLIATVGAGYALAIDALTFVVSAVRVLAVQLKGDSRMNGGLSLVGQLKEGFSCLREKRWILVVVIHSGLINGCVIAPIMVLGPLVAKTHLAGVASWAAIGVATASGALLGSVFGMRWKTQRLLSAGIAVVLAATPMIVGLACAVPTVWVAAAAVLFGLQSSLYMSAMQTVLQQHVAGALIGRISAYLSLGGLVLMPAGLALAGMASERFGMGAVLCFAAFALIASTLAALAVPQVRSLRSPQ